MIRFGDLIFPDAWALGPPDVPERGEDDDEQQYLEFVETIASAPTEGGTL